jgi:hypothetical protein
VCETNGSSEGQKNSRHDFMKLFLDLFVDRIKTRCWQEPSGCISWPIKFNVPRAQPNLVNKGFKSKGDSACQIGLPADLGSLKSRLDIKVDRARRQEKERKKVCPEFSRR